MTSENTEEKARGETLKRFRSLRVFSFFVSLAKKSRLFLFPAYVLFGIPQIFVFGYYFPSLLTRHNPLGYLKAVFFCGLAASWISLPLLAAFLLLGQLAFRKHLRGVILLPAGMAAGYAWVVAWNLLIDPTFHYLRSFLPVLLCVLFSLGIPLFFRFYRHLIMSLTRKDNASHQEMTHGETVTSRVSVQTPFDRIIRGGEVIDGTNTAARKVDIGIKDDRIAAVGDLSKAGAEEELDAGGLLVTPGFIDVHSHSDAYLLLEPDAPSKLSQGVTTEINGQCGGSAVPRLGPARLSSDWASQTYPSLRQGRLVCSSAAGPTWTTVASYRELFDAVRPSINTIQFIGHNTLRAGVMGYGARTATPDDMKELSRRLEQALEEGGWGLSTGLLYQPGKYSTEEEVIGLARVAAKKGAMYATHMRSESARLLEAVDEVLRLARATGIQVEVSHLKTSGKKNWGKIDALLEKLLAARKEGINLQSDRYPYVAAGTDLDVVLPDWAGEGGRDPELARIADASTRARVVDELNASGRDWSSVMIGGGWSDLTRGFCGQTLAAAAAALRRTPGETVCDFIAADLTRTGAFFFGMSEENLHRIYEIPWIMPGSDASVRAPWGVLGRDFPHPRAYGTMPRFFRLLTGKVEGFAKICSREEAVYRMTGLPASVFGICGRGAIKTGAYADIAVWNEKEFCERATYDKPHQFSAGVTAVFVNGVLSYKRGSFTGNRAGRFLARQPPA